MSSSAPPTTGASYRPSPQQRRLVRLEPLPRCRVTVTLEGSLDQRRLSRALAHLVADEEALRTRVTVEEGEPRARVMESASPTAALVVIPEAPDPSVSTDLAEASEPAGSSAEASAPGAEPLRVTLQTLGVERHRLVLSLASTVADQRAVMEVVTLLVAAYEDAAAVATDRMPHSEVAEILDTLLVSEDTEEGRDHWRWFEVPPGSLWHPPASLEVVTRPVGAASLPAGVAGTTAEAFLLAAWVTLLARRYGADAEVVGRGVPGRTYDEVSDCIGPLAKYLPVAPAYDGSEPLEELARRLAVVLEDHVDFQDYFLLSADSGNVAGPAPRFPFAFDAFDDGRPRELSAAALRFVVDDVESWVDGASLRLRCHLGAGPAADGGFGEDSSEGWRLILHGDGGTYDGAELRLLAEQLTELLRHGAAAPATPVARLSLLPAAHRQQLLVDVQCTAPQLVEEGNFSLPQLALRWAALDPQRLAVEGAGETLSYAALDAASESLARSLRALGVGPEAIVGVLLPRTPELLVALLAILRSGAAYLPLDAALAPARRAYMMENSGCRWLLCRGDSSGEEELPSSVQRLDLLDEDWRREVAPLPDPITIAPQSLAIVIYTSGSTGKPKGVQVPHGAVVNFLLSAAQKPGLGSDDELAGLTTIAFDISILELFLPLSVGARLRLVDRATATDGSALAALLREHPPTLLQATPSTWRMLRAAEWESLPGMVMVSGGEALSGALAAELKAGGGTLWNVYGPTETTIWCTLVKVESTPDLAQVPVLALGDPVARTELYVVDAALQPVGYGETGELVVGGASVTRGYRDLPALTAERYVPDPFGLRPGARLYRTGDLVLRRPGGTPEYLGRSDFQVKIRGHRIELGEIEVALRSHPAVREAVVAARPDALGVAQLVAYLLLMGSEPPSAAELRSHLAELPEAMLPAHFVTLDTYPLTTSGKVDRRALPEPGPASREVAFEAPRPGVEERLAAIWAEVLGLETTAGGVGRGDHFFSLGGHSLSGTALIHRVGGSFGVSLPLAILFDEPTLGGFATALLRQRLAQASDDEVWQAMERLGLDDAAATGAGSRESLTLGPLEDLEAVATELGLGRREAERIEKAPRVGNPPELPLSFAQQRLWFIDRYLGGRSPGYNLVGAARIHGPLAPGPLAIAMNEIVRRHEVLRTTYTSRGEASVQRIHPPSPVPLPAVDLTAVEDPMSTALELAGAEARRPFDLEIGPVLRCRLLRLGAGDHVVVVNIHHIASDAWSNDLFMEELGYLYRAARDGVAGTEPARSVPELAIQYGDFAVWQRRWLEDQAGGGDAAVEFWRSLLALADETPLPLDRPRPRQQRFDGARLEIRWPEELAQSLETTAAEVGASLYMLLLAALGSLFYRTTGVERPVFGSPFAGRHRPQVEKLIGFFINTLPLPVEVEGSVSFLRTLEAVRSMVLGVQEQQDLPFEHLLDVLDVHREPSKSPLYQVVFNFLNSASQTLAVTPELTLELLEPDPAAAKFDLILSLQRRLPATGSNEAGVGEAGLVGFLEYKPSLFDAATVAAVEEQLRRLLEGIADSRGITAPDRLPLLSATQRRQLTSGHPGRGEGRPIPPADPAPTIHRRFLRAAAQHPQRVAVSYEGESLTYGELELASRRAALELRRRGVGLEVRVGLCFSRGLDLVVAILSVLRAGGAYVPLDPTYPEQRLRFLAEDGDLELILAEPTTEAPLPAALITPWSRPAAEADNPEDSAGELAELDAVAVEPGNAAYVIFTSGSTGRPKGVVVPHGNVLRLFSATDPWFEFGAEDVWTLFHSYAFDFSVWEIWGALLHGARLVVVPYWVSRSPVELYGLLLDEGVTVLNQSPSAFSQLVAHQSRQSPEELPPLPLRFVIFGGEALDLPTLTPWFHRQGEQRPRLVNMYGITETTVHVTHRPLGARDVGFGPGTPVGEPIPDLTLYLLDPRMEPLPVGSPGELYVGGAGLARGYLRRPALTAQRFVPDPFGDQPGGRLYRSGDQARLLRDGEIAFLGRFDDQVQIRGFRVELGEVQAALAEHGGIQQCVVIARPDIRGDLMLAAFYVPNSGSAATPTTADLREHLSTRIPAYMVPRQLAALDRLPLTSHGKLDRRALPAMEESLEPRAGGADGKVSWETSEERQLAEIWQRALGVEGVGPEDNFFDLGGDSILGIRVVAIAQEQDLELSLQQLFQHQAVRPLARELAVTGAAKAGGVAPGILRAAATAPFALLPPELQSRLPEGVEDAYPTSRLQLGMIYEMQLEPERLPYHNVDSVRYRASLDEGAFRRATELLVARHEILRTSFELSRYGQPLQLVHRTAELELRWEDLRALDEDEQRRRTDAYIAEERQTAFDLSRPSLLRFAIHRLTDDSFRFTATECHPILDGWSLTLLLRDLFTFHQALALNPSFEPEPLPAVRYRDFIRLELDSVASKTSRSYWREQLDGFSLLTIPRWPVVDAAPASEENGGAPPSHLESFGLDADVVERLRGLARGAQVPLKTVFLGAHLRTLALLTGTRDVLTGVQSNGRPEVDGGEAITGLFLNSLPLRLRLPSGPWPKLLRAVFAAEQEALPHRRFPLADIQRELGAPLLFETFFNYVSFHVAEGVLSSGAVDLLPDAVYHEPTHFPLSVAFNLSSATGELLVQVECDPARYPRQQVRSFSGLFRAVLDAMVDPSTASRDTFSLVFVDDAQRETLSRHLVRALRRDAQGLTFLDLWTRQVAETSGAPALVQEGREPLSYGELDRRARALATVLRRRGVTAEVAVGLFLERGEAVPVAIVGTLLAGGVYVPLDPTYPRERLDFLIQDAGLSRVLTRRGLVERLPAGVEMLLVDEGQWEPGEDAALVPAPPALSAAFDSQSLACILYTFDSIGLPKGVGVSHANLANLCFVLGDAYGIGPGERVLQVPSLDFDISIEEIFPTFARGATLVLPPTHHSLSGVEMVALMNSQRLTVVNFPTAYWHAFVNEILTAGVVVPPGLRLMIVGGEQANPAVLAKWRQAGGLRTLRWLNTYGPMETSVTASCFEVGPEAEPVDEALAAVLPMGRPLDSFRLFVLDAALEPVPLGVVGELFIGGPAVARGYLGHPSRTATSFVPDPFVGPEQAGGRLFRTADLVRCLPSGDLEFMGRIDPQVKIQGYRVEIGGVESTLSAHPAVEECTVDDSFDLGDHSLRATQAVPRGRETFGVDLPLRALFEAPTVAPVASRTAPLAEPKPAPPAWAAPPREGRLPLSFAQERLWFMAQLAPSDAFYNMSDAVRLRGPLAPWRLRACFTAIVRRHEVLRTVFQARDGRPHQVILEPSVPALPVVDLRALPALAAQGEACRLTSVEARRPFDLARSPLLRTILLRRGAEDHELLLTVHHIVSDGWSSGIFLRELTALWNAGVEVFETESPFRIAGLDPLPLQYADYAAAQRQGLQGEVLEAQLEVWRRRLDGAPTLLSLPTDRPRPPVPNDHGGTVPLRLSEPLSQRFQTLTRSLGTTPFISLLALWQGLLARVSGQREFLIGTPVANRQRVEVEPLIGFFANTVAIRSTVESADSFRHLVRRVQEVSLEAFQHQDLPFEQLVEAINLQWDFGHSPLLQIMFVVQEMPPELILQGLEAQSVDFDTGLSKVDLGLTLVDGGDRFFGSLNYSSALFDATTAKRWWGSLVSLLEQVVKSPTVPLASLSVLSGAQRQQLVVEWNDTSTAYPADATVDSLFFAMARSRPSAVALVAAGNDGQTLTYGEVAARAGELARRLTAARVTTDQPVALALERSPELVIAVLAVLAAGGAYLPLEASLPESRRDVMLTRVGTRVVVSRGELPWAASLGLEVVEIDSVTEDLRRGTTDLATTDVAMADLASQKQSSQPLSLAYVMFTSGSTGLPKAVAVPHRAVIRLVLETNYLSWGAEQTFLQLAPPAFDLSTLEIWGPLLHGARLVLAPPGPLALEEIGAVLERYEVTTLWLTAGLFHQMVDHRLAALAGVRQLLAGGDVLSVPHVRRVVESLSPAAGGVTRLFNGYGPTENTTFTSVEAISLDDRLRTSGQSIPIGRLISNTTGWVLDEALRPVAPGVVGELMIGGDGLARGYLGDPARTAVSFVPSPFGVGERLYHSGDHARTLGDGRLEFHGRRDHQVKVRGHRIELGEIEGQLAAHPAIVRCVVVADGDRLVAWSVLADADADAPTPAALREHLASGLPEVMIPSLFGFLAELPLGGTGKVDRRALPSAESLISATPTAHALAPRTAVEVALVEIYREVLFGDSITGEPAVGVEADFFALGGHSLLAVQVTSRVATVLGVELPLRTLLEAPTVAQLAPRVEAALLASADGQGALAALPPLEAVADRGAMAPLSFAQERLWFLDRLEPGSAAYNIPSATRMRGSLAMRSLELALGEIQRRHEVLRTTYHQQDGAAVQVVAPYQELAVPVVDLSTLAAATGEAEALRLVAAEALHPFDLARGPVLRTRLLRLGSEHHITLVTVHHIAFDGWSMGVFREELGAQLAAFETGAPSPTQADLKPLAVQYADYALWQRRWLRGEVLEQQLTYWRERLAGPPSALELPTDRPRPSTPVLRGASFSRPAAPELGARLEALGRRASATLFMTLVAGLGETLGRLAGQRDVTVGTPVANRRHQRAEDLIGFFVNTLVLRLSVGDPAASFDELLVQARERSLEAFSHGDVSFERLVEALQPDRSSNRSPLYQVLFALQSGDGRGSVAGPLGGALALSGLELEPVMVASSEVKSDLMVVALPTASGLEWSVEYAVDLFDATTVKRWLGALESLLEQAVASPAAPLASLSLLSDAQRQQLVVEWNDTSTAYPADATVDSLFFALARSRPSAVALVAADADGQTLTYGEVAARALALARRLTAAGVVTDQPVALALERSPELVIAVLAVLAAGGAYLPLDASLPPDRRDAMLTGVGTRVVVSRGELAWAASLGLEVVEIDSVTEDLRAGTTDLASQNQSSLPSSLAYVMFTSGSTGLPKAVAVPHRAVIRLVRETNYLRFGPEQTFLQLAPAAFDASTLEIWGALLHGARLVLAPPGALTLEQLGALLGRHEVTTLWLTAGLFHQMVDHRLEALAGVHQLLAGGDVLSVPHVARVVRTLGPAAGGVTRFFNGYGPTENTTFASVEEIGVDDRLQVSGQPIPVGRLISNTTGWVLDEALRPVAPGVVGELMMGGAGLARGYLGDPARTAVSFVPSPFGVGERLYHSGDHVRTLQDGRLEFHGRRDHQVKVRGHRVELGEIEGQLAVHPAIVRCVVVADGDRLVAWSVLADADTEAPTPAALREHLAAGLPEVMIPSLFGFLDELPLGGTGKVDRRALPSAESLISAPPTAQALAPRTAVEAALVEIYREVLFGESSAGGPPVGVEADFFALGGHSLLAVQVTSRIASVLGVELPLRALFEAPTVALLAPRVEAALLASAGGQGALAALPPLEAVADRRTMAPLSFAQERLWFLDRLEPGSAAYNIPNATRLRGPLCVRALERTLGEMVRRHEILRTVYAEREGKAVQVVALSAAVEMPVVDLSALPKAAAAAQVARLTNSEALRSFDLSRGPILRSLLLRLHRRHHVSLTTVHHIAFDGWSMRIFQRELGVLWHAYAAGEPSPLAEPKLQYADYALWQRRWLAGPVLEAQLAYWRERLAHLPPALELPVDRPRPTTAGFHAALRRRRLSESLSRRLEAFGRSTSSTLFMVGLAGVSWVLGRISHQDDLAVGTPVANRRHRNAEDLIGFFVNTLVLRSGERHGATFESWAGQLRETSLGAFAHQDLPFERLVEALQPRRDPGRTPLFQVLYSVDSFALPAGANPSLGGPPDLQAEGLPLGQLMAKFDLDVQFSGPADALELSAKYAVELFDATSVDRLLAAVEFFFDQALADPRRPLASLPLMSPAQRHQVELEWNDVATVADPEPRLTGFFEELAASQPQRVALAQEGATQTYGELEERSAAVAVALRARGVGPETVVGVCVERSFDLLAALYGILRAGGAFVPLDPDYPPARLRFMARDSRAELILVDTACEPRLRQALELEGSPDDPPLRVSLLSVVAARAEGREGSEVLPRVVGDGAAYMIYTSGSTGRPKGVLVPHRGIVNHLRWMQRTYPLGADDRVLAKTAYSFDASLWELFAPLSAGATLVLARAGSQRDLAYLARELGRSNITALRGVPSFYRALATEGALEALGSLRLVISGGEPLTPDLAVQLARREGGAGPRQVVNVYGPTEASIVSTSWSVASPPANPVPIGRPMDNARVVVLDRHGAVAAPGSWGELAVGSLPLARGYHGRAGLTAWRFVPDPGGDRGARVYRTGDRARQRHDGAVEFGGRLDQQVKVRGFRIELGEIEAVLRSAPGVKDVVVVVMEDSTGGGRLVAYGTGPGFSHAMMRGYLASRLPEYMVPGQLLSLEALPVLPNGKVDRRSLPTPEQLGDGESAVVPATALEASLVNIWADALERPQLGVLDDFFEAGGHSLLAVQIMAAIRRRLGVEVPVAALFQHRTVRGLATVLASSPGAEPSSSALLESAEPVVEMQRGEEPPLVLVHPVGGNVFSYVPLVRALTAASDGTPAVWGLQAPHRQDPNHDVPLEQLAREYREALARRELRGPIRLGGWSFGGVVALEIARQMKEAGQEVVGPLLLLDSYLRPSDLAVGAEDDELEMLNAFLINLVGANGTEAADNPPITPSFQEALETGAVGLLTDLHPWILQQRLLPATVDVPALLNLWATFRRHRRALRRYSPRPTPVVAHLYRAVGADGTHADSEQMQAWIRVVEALHVVDVATDHHGVVKSPHIERIVEEWLRSILSGTP